MKRVGEGDGPFTAVVAAIIIIIIIIIIVWHMHASAYTFPTSYVSPSMVSSPAKLACTGTFHSTSTGDMGTLGDNTATDALPAAAVGGTGMKENSISPGNAREGGSVWSISGIPGRRGERMVS